MYIQHWPLSCYDTESPLSSLLLICSMYGVYERIEDFNLDAVNTLIFSLWMIIFENFYGILPYSEVMKIFACIPF